VALNEGYVKPCEGLHEMYEGYSKSNLRWAVKKTSIEKKKFIYTKNMYILKLVLSIVTAGIEAIVLGSKFMYVCVKEVCQLWVKPHCDTFHQLLIVVEALWSQPILQVDEQLLVTWSKIRALRTVVKQLPVEMLQ
jgi:hypothetical protein